MLKFLMLQFASSGSSKQQKLLCKCWNYKDPEDVTYHFEIFDWDVSS